MKMPSGRSALSIGVVSALAVILVALALLQYRWIGQVSEADRERIEIGLQTSIAQFRREFQNELLRVCTAFRLDPRALADKSWDRYVERYDDWIRVASHPDLVANLFVWEFGDASASRLSRLNPDAGRLEPESWPPRLEQLRQSLAALAQETRRTLGRDRFRVWTMDERIPALFHPLLQFYPPREAHAPPPPRVAGFFIVELNMAYLRQKLLPDLARRHFSGPEGFLYRVEIVSQENPDKPIYTSDPALSQEVLASADARVRLLGTPHPASPQFAARDEPGTAERQGGRDLAERPEFPPPPILPAGDSGRWELVVKHRYGSVDAVVADLRHRNLAVSFGVLLLLAVSMAMIIISTQRARRLAKLQMDFVAGVSHELRTPLAVICSAGDNLAEGVVDPSPEVKEYGALVRNEGRRLRGMVEQILLFAAGQSGRRYELRPVQVAAVVDSTLADAGPMIQEAGFSVEKQIAPGLPLVLADEAALKQCVQNLVNNALKYGGDSRWMGVRASVHGSEVRITVEDKGPGIDPADLRHIFEPFYRGRAAKAARTHGTGLGLSLAKDIAEAMGGRITVHSTPGKGSAFALHLPAMKA